jgi:hypothetical protein
MARPLFFLALFTLVALAALRFLLGLAGVAGFLFGLLLKVALVAFLIWVGVRIVNPEAARKMREHFMGPDSP